MKYLYILVISVTFLFVFSCGSASSTTNVNPHAQKHIDMHNEFINEKNKEEMVKIAKDISGSYSGILPCSDCDQINYKLTINDDLTFSSQALFKGRSDELIKEDGEFLISNDLIMLNKQESSMKFFQIKNNRLIMLDKNRNEFTGDRADKYILLPITNDLNSDKSSPKQSFLIDKYKNGIDFYASGNEPFWSLNMDFAKNFKFTNADGFEMNVPAIKPIHAMDANVNRYRSVIDTGEMIIQIIKEKCQDTMADEEFNYTVSIDIKSNKDKDYKSFKGCGNYVPDYRLHNIWVVRQVNGKIINEEDFDRKIPQLEIKPFENKISGNDGCNGFFGEIEVINGIIVFGNIAGTMMACTNMDLSSQITKTIGGNKLRYTIRNDMLIFNEKEKEVMVLKRVD